LEGSPESLAAPGERKRTSKWNYAMERESRKVVTSALFTPVHECSMHHTDILMVLHL
jgi:hypothetical protein